ncbi:MAG: ChbG/HpnK family deacetylase [Pseudolabrys sp.]
MAHAERRIWLCADDYGISPAVNSAIRELILRGRLNATSVMTAAPHLDANEATALGKLNSGEKRVAIGLHVTLTAPFKALSDGFAPLLDSQFLPLKTVMRLVTLRRLKVGLLAREVTAQVEAFVAAFGRTPDFIDGHQHVHLFPQVRDAVLQVTTEMAPHAWVRQCGRAPSARRLKGRKELLIDILSVGFRRKARRLGVATNPAFAGAYNFDGKPAFAAIFPRFLAGLPDGGLIMCHPGFVDAELERLDSLTHQREREFAYFNSEEFQRVLAEQGVALAKPD